MALPHLLGRKASEDPGAAGIPYHPRRHDTGLLESDPNLNVLQLFDELVLALRAPTPPGAGPGHRFRCPEICGPDDRARPLAMASGDLQSRSQQLLRHRCSFVRTPREGHEDRAPARPNDHRSIGTCEHGDAGQPAFEICLQLHAGEIRPCTAADPRAERHVAVGDSPESAERRGLPHRPGRDRPDSVGPLAVGLFLLIGLNNADFVGAESGNVAGCLGNDGIPGQQPRAAATLGVGDGVLLAQRVPSGEGIGNVHRVDESTGRLLPYLSSLTLCRGRSANHQMLTMVATTPNTAAGFAILRERSDMGLTIPASTEVRDLSHPATWCHRGLRHSSRTPMPSLSPLEGRTQGCIHDRPA
jgi:hypothetical protein